MTNRFFSPDQQFISNTGDPYAGGFLYFYATGTSTKQDTYSDQALTIANTNPIVLDSNGQAGSVFLQNLAYKVVLTDINDVQIWTMDPVYSSDYSTFAQFQPWGGNPNGLVAGVAGTQGTLPGSSAVWDYVDNILYICTTTGNAATAVWTGINASSATPAIPAPQGYLTLNTDPSNPILTTDAISSVAVYYTPYVGNLVPVYNGASFVTTLFSQLTLTLSASQALNTLYDVFVFNNTGVLTLVTGPAWATSTAGLGARGTGAGTTQLQRLNGLWVNAVQITGRNAAATYTIPANTATYLGTILIDGTAGQVTCTTSYGQSRKWGVWNAYNRQTLLVKAGDPSGGWSYTTNAIRPANGNTANSISVLCGLPEEPAIYKYANYISSALTSANQSTTGQVGIGFNSTTAFSGRTGRVAGSVTSSSFITNFSLEGEYEAQPVLGFNVITALENGLGSINSYTWNATEQFMVLSAQWRG